MSGHYREGGRLLGVAVKRGSTVYLCKGLVAIHCLGWVVKWLCIQTSKAPANFTKTQLSIGNNILYCCAMACSVILETECVLLTCTRILVLTYMKRIDQLGQI